MNISLNSYVKNKKKKKILRGPRLIFYNPALYQKKTLLSVLHSNLNVVSYVLQLNEFSFNHLICTNKLINLYPR